MNACNLLNLNGFAYVREIKESKGDYRDLFLCMPKFKNRYEDFIGTMWFYAYIDDERLFPLHQMLALHLKVNHVVAIQFNATFMKIKGSRYSDYFCQGETEIGCGEELEDLEMNKFSIHIKSIQRYFVNGSMIETPNDLFQGNSKGTGLAL